LVIIINHLLLHIYLTFLTIVTYLLSGKLSSSYS